MDEIIVPTGEINGETDYYYRRKKVVPEIWKKKPRKNWPEKVMVAIGICWKGTSRIYMVPPKTKVNAKAFLNLILQPITFVDIPRLYGK